MILSIFSLGCSTDIKFFVTLQLGELASLEDHFKRARGIASRYLASSSAHVVTHRSTQVHQITRAKLTQQSPLVLAST